MVFQFIPSHLTLGGPERSNQGHWLFIGLCIIDNVLLDSGAVRPRGPLFKVFVYIFLGMILINCQVLDLIELFNRLFARS